MSDRSELARKLGERLGYWIEIRAGIFILVYKDGTCHPASAEEAELWEDDLRLSEELAARTANYDYYKQYAESLKAELERAEQEANDLKALRDHRYEDIKNFTFRGYNAEQLTEMIFKAEADAP